jgi:phenylacetate-CoA ligase
MMPTPTVTPSSFRALRGNLQTALLAGLPEQVARIGWSRAQIRSHQQHRLRVLLGYAAGHSPFHARRLAGIDLDAVGGGDLSPLPVMTKTQMMSELDDVFTDRRLTRAMVEQALTEAGPDPATLFGSYLALASGGSSGERGVFVLDTPASVQFFGALSRGLVARLATTGGPPPGGLPIAMVGAGSPVHATGLAAPLCDGGALPFRFLPVPVTLPLPEIVARLNALQAPTLYGYPSMLARLAAERTAGRLRISPVMVTRTSETCTSDLRTAISAGFGAPLIDTFGSTEGLVGASAPDEDVITFAEDGCIVELVDEQYRPVPPGTPSAAVLVTNLTNLVQPLIRYELTDSFVQQPAAAAHGFVRARVQGRSGEVFRYGEATIHPLVIRSVLVHSRDVQEFQVRQTPGGIDATVVADHGIDLATLRQHLAAALAGAGLADPDVAVRAVPRLERHPITGKLCRFEPLH